MIGPVVPGLKVWVWDPLALPGPSGAWILHQVESVDRDGVIVRLREPGRVVDSPVRLGRVDLIEREQGYRRFDDRPPAMRYEAPAVQEALL